MESQIAMFVFEYEMYSFRGKFNNNFFSFFLEKQKEDIELLNCIRNDI